MGHIGKCSKQPCRICRKWFTPHPRLGNRQKTCGEEECKKKWHTKKCAEWNKKNRSYFQAIYLNGKLQSKKTKSQPEGRHPPSSNPEKIRPISPPSFRFAPQLPRDVIQEVIGVQPLIIIEYVSQLLVSSFKEVIRAQPVEIQRKIKQVPCEGRLRSDRLRQGP
jgi:hypothetical protein